MPLTDRRTTRVMCCLGASTLMTLASPSAEASQPTPTAASQTATLPPKGNAMYGLGIASVTLGILNVGYGIPLAIVCPTDVCFPGAIGLGFGAAFIAAGVPAIYFGKRRRASYRAWRETVEVDPRDRPAGPDLRPPHGVGLLVGGTVMVAGSSALLLIGFLNLGSTDGYGRPAPLPTWSKWGMGIGAVGLVGGSVMLGFGGRFARQRRAWIRSHSTVAASPWLLPGGFGLGVAGRF